MKKKAGMIFILIIIVSVLTGFTVKGIGPEEVEKWPYETLRGDMRLNYIELGLALNPDKDAEVKKATVSRFNSSEICW